VAQDSKAKTKARVKPKWATDIGDIRGKLALKKITIENDIPMDEQPMSNIEWVDMDKLHSNEYNPNFVYKTELTLLKISLLEDGWTAPIVARRTGEIVDGFHRWYLMGDKQVYKMTGGKVPVAYLQEGTDPAHQVMSTIRHNRARGAHIIVDMAEIVYRLLDVEKVPKEEVMERLQMESEEVDRLYSKGDMLQLGSKKEFGKGWVPMREDSFQK